MGGGGGGGQADGQPETEGLQKTVNRLVASTGPLHCTSAITLILERGEGWYPVGGGGGRDGGGGGRAWRGGGWC